MDKGTPYTRIHLLNSPPITIRADKNEIKIMMMIMIKMIWIKNDVCVSNANIKCRSLLLSKVVFKTSKKTNRKKRRNRYALHTQKIMITIIINKMNNYSNNNR